MRMYHKSSTVNGNKFKYKSKCKRFIKKYVYVSKYRLLQFKQPVFDIAFM